jgi:hypothetical protein
MRFFILLFSLMLVFGCVGGQTPQDTANPAHDIATGADQPPASNVSANPAPYAPSSQAAELLQPDDLHYLGAFRLPGPSGGSNWEYSGYAMTFYPDGDPGGPDDGYPGSLYAIGHDHQQMVSEISIPEPVIGSPESMNTATTLRPFTDITNGMFGYLEIPRAGLEYLPAQGNQTSGKLYFSWGQHFEFEQMPTHGMADLDLTNTEGPWYFGEYTSYATNDYIFEIPESWAAANTPGKRLASGRFRDGLWSGRGPALFAYGPWNDNLSPNSTLSATPLLLYGTQNPGAVEIESGQSTAMANFSESDEWSGGAWLTSGNKSAVIFVGTKGLGNTWYGFSNGVVYPTSGDPGESYPEVPDWPHDSRGWWSEGVSARIIFYDPADLAKVASGAMETYEPQPYAMLDVDDFLLDPGYDFEMGKRYLVGACAFDRENGVLYIMERQADGDKSVVHAWKVG